MNPTVRGESAIKLAEMAVLKNKRSWMSGGALCVINFRDNTHGEHSELEEPPQQGCEDSEKEKKDGRDNIDFVQC